jgi:hypothetical protein
MKNLQSILSVFVLGIFIIASSCKSNQTVLRTNEVPDVTHVHLNDFPKEKYYQ